MSDRELHPAQLALPSCRGCYGTGKRDSLYGRGWVYCYCVLPLEAVPPKDPAPAVEGDK